MTVSSDNWRPFPDKYPLAYRRLEIRYVNGEVVTGVIATAEGEWQSDDIDNIMPPLGGHWRYEGRQHARSVR